MTSTSTSMAFAERVAGSPTSSLGRASNKGSPVAAPAPLKADVPSVGKNALVVFLVVFIIFWIIFEWWNGDSFQKRGADGKPNGEVDHWRTVIGALIVAALCTGFYAYGFNCALKKY